MTLSWVPTEACTLPTAEQPLRVAEFDDLFAKAVEVEHLSPTRASILLEGSDGLEAVVRDLAARETSCCSFFDFTVTRASVGEPPPVRLDVSVPSEHADVLSALVGRIGHRPRSTL